MDMPKFHGCVSWFVAPLTCPLLVHWLEEEFNNARSIQTSVKSSVVGVCLQRRNWNQPRVRGLFSLFVAQQGHLNYKRSLGLL